MKRPVGKQPAFSISLKGMDAAGYETACQFREQLIRRIAFRNRELPAPCPPREERDAFRKLPRGDMTTEGMLTGSLTLFSCLKEEHDRGKAMILIGEYDVSPAEACDYGCQDRMIVRIRNQLQQAWKTNSCLESDGLTGCMNVRKRSIFTGLNQLVEYSAPETWLCGQPGVAGGEGLSCQGLSAPYGEVMEWHESCHFRAAGNCCPGDADCCCGRPPADPDAEPCS